MGELVGALLSPRAPPLPPVVGACVWNKAGGGVVSLEVAGATVGASLLKIAVGAAVRSSDPPSPPSSGAVP